MASLETPLPAEKLPACWSDDTRMNALFAPCRHVSIAPEAWQQKMTFWSEQLRSWCRHRRSPLVSLSAARSAFSRGRNRPACLDVVLDQYIRSGEYVPASSYAKALSGAGEGWVRWGARVAFKPAALAVGLLTSLLPLDRTPHDGMATAKIDHDELYVNQVVVKELATELLASFPESCERVGTLDELMESAGYARAERPTFEIVLGYMMTADLAIKKGELYKLADAGSGSKVQPVNEREEALHRLLTAERRLTADLDRFSAEEESALVDTRNALRLGNKTLAKSHLRRKHRSAGRAAGSEAALENVRRILLEMRQAEFNSSIVGTYKMSVGAMKRVMKEENLDEDTAHETMDELREVLETYSEVEKSLAGGLQDVDAAELEDELEVLLASDPKGGAAGGSPRGQRERGRAGGKPADRRRERTDKEFVFDGEERMIAELNELSLPDLGEPAASPRAAERTDKPSAAERVPVPAGDWDGRDGRDAKTDVPKTRAKKPEPTKPTKEWYPPADESLSESKPKNKDLPWSLKKIDNLESMGANYSLEALSNSMSELRTDPRLHPGQKLNPNSSSTGRILYNTDFQVQDHRLDDGVWIFNANDDDRNHSYSECDQNYASRNESRGNRNESDRNRNQEDDNQSGQRSEDRNDRKQGYSGRTEGQRGRNQGYNERNEIYGDRNQNYGGKNRECESAKQSYGNGNENDRNQDYGERNQNYSERNQDYGERNQNYSERNQDYGERNQNYSDCNQDNSERNQNYSERNQDGTSKSKKDKSVNKQRNISEDFTNSTEYSEDLSDGNSGTDHQFQMAPGGERPSRREPRTDDDVERNMEDLERRLKNLRSFNL